MNRDVENPNEHREWVAAKEAAANNSPSFDTASLRGGGVPATEKGASGEHVAQQV